MSSGTRAAADFIAKLCQLTDFEAERAMVLVRAAFPAGAAARMRAMRDRQKGLQNETSRVTSDK